VPPSIINAPASVTTNAGATVVFTVTAGGTAPLGYQWLFNGTNLAEGSQYSGTMTPTLSLSNAQPAQAGSYSVVASNAQGTATSAVAVLTVLVPPGITLQPTNQTVLAGTTVSFSAAASGSAPLSYQWQFNSTNLNGAVSQTLSLTNVQPAQAGAYNLLVTNSAGWATSQVATLTILVPPGITLQPTNQTVLAGATVNFSAAASGTMPLSYQWQFNNTNLDGALSQLLSLPNVQPEQAGAYNLLVANSAGSVTSVVAILTVAYRPLLLNAKTTQQGAFAFTLSGAAGLVYMVETTTNFTNWTPLTSMTNTTGLADFTDTASSNSISRFYRARWMP
jgi:hypothetical protein